VVAAGNAVYVLGGPGSTAIDRFDGRRWATIGRIPGPALNATAAVELGKKIYVIGGFIGAGNRPTTTVRTLDPATRKWARVADLPAERGGHAAVVLDGRIHVLGGGNSVSTIADHSVFDPATSKWTAAAPLPRAEGSPAAVVFDGKIWAIGGRSGFSDYGDVYVYDAAADRWTPGPGIPPRGTAGAAVLGGAIYVFGGESQPAAKVLGDVFRLRSGETKWTRVARLPAPRNYARAVVFRGGILVVGGSPSFGNSHGAYGSTIVDRFLPPR
jgi:N-acetylneuraminic acid mutarotase